MSVIVTITFSPCIDKSTSVASFVPEKKLNCRFPKLELGGGGINIAKALKRLGGAPIAIFPVGGCSGETFLNMMRAEQFQSVIIPTKNETRENLIVIDESNQQQYRFIMPSQFLGEKEWQQCLDAISAIEKTDYIVVSGSLPFGFPPNIFRQLAGIAKTKNTHLCVDTSGEALKAAAEAGVYLLKPNLAELSMLAGLKEINTHQVENIARKLILKKKCQVMVVSMGSLGAMLITKNQSFLTPAPQIKPISTSGAGDSMLAGIVFSLAKGESMKQSLNFGVACGSAATLNAGTELFYVSDVEKLLSMINKE